jgi:hypothetical protein
VVSDEKTVFKWVYDGWQEMWLKYESNIWKYITDLRQKITHFKKKKNFYYSALSV